MRFISIAILLVILSACERTLSPTKPFVLDTNPPKGSRIFQQGYTDGCETGLSGMGNQFTKVFHDFQYDTQYADNKVYNRMWDTSNNYCRLFLFVNDEHLNSPDFERYNKPFWFMGDGK
ncbi:MAG: hypothetical protein K0R63_538 [Rickettsiales bacterium]|jgi:hypothetical protein|nr:hypothetical protein [Rickettsiales bacterium]